MSGVEAHEAMEALHAYDVTARAFSDPEVAKARTSATPQPMFVDLMTRAPVRDLGGGDFSVLRMEDVLFLTRHKEVLQGSIHLGSDRPAIPLGLDGAEHRKYRRLLDPVFTAKRIAPLEPAIRDRARELIDRFSSDGRVDAYAAWAEPLPSSIFLSIMGLPLDDLEDFLHFKDLTLGTGPSANAPPQERLANRATGVAWIQDYFDRDLDAREREAAPRDDMIGWLLTTEVEGNRLSREEILDILGLLMIAGLDTVAASLSCFLSHLARNPEHRARLVAEPMLWPSAIEELLRFESPVTDGFRRVVERDLELPSGAVLPKGSFIHVSWSTANLDPDFFDDPLVVDFERSPNKHIGFASGWHRCLGSHLARLELRAAMEVWHECIPDYEIEPNTDLLYSMNPRAPHHLPLVW